ncbi:MAG: beta-glucosidase BglX [Dysgonamonadaceae bacterium]|jgi:beta-glucosidase|nr:beta-glucosidase BglX [Dysgonamonadaceae bacterium]
MKKLFLLTVIMALWCCSDKTGEADNMKIFVDELMRKMTLEEKIGQLNLPTVGFDVTGPILSSDVEAKIKAGLVGGVFNTFTPTAVRKLQEIAVNETRLHIPLIFGYDVIHGHRTIFPIPLGISATWDTDLIEKVAVSVADEATADGLHWTFSPMVDIARDPRWGRVSEGAGEDPFLGSAIAKAMVKGYEQGDLSNPNTLMSCIKHFALYGAAEAGRDYNTVDMSKIRMYNEYLPPYKAAVDAGASSVMTSFNEVDGIPATGNKWLLNDLLRLQWGFEGFVVTDYTAIMEMENHGVGNSEQVTERSINAGVDMDMVSEYMLKYLPALVKSGKIPEKQIDSACRRILEAKYKLGLFSDPFRGLSEERADTHIMSDEKLDLCREAAEKSFVLLKNENQVLPLNKNQKIAFIGPLIKDQRNLIGNWSGAGDWKRAESIWSALVEKFGTAHFDYALGCNLIDDSCLMKKLNQNGGQLTIDPLSPQQLINQALQIARNADVIVAALGEPFGMSGEAASRSDISLPENQKTLLKALKNTGKPIVLLLMNGRPLCLQWENDNLDAILETWYPGTKAGEAIVNTIFGIANPSGKLSISFPRNVGQIPIYYNHKNTGRPMQEEQKYTSKYLDVSNDPLYPFGYGLSYSDFEYADLSLSDSILSENGRITASVTLTNKGAVEATETVQLYIRDLAGSITRPVKELKGFQQVSLQPGESKNVAFTIDTELLKFYNAALKYVCEPGDFHVFIGGNSATKAHVGFTLK